MVFEDRYEPGINDSQDRTLGTISFAKVTLKILSWYRFKFSSSIDFNVFYIDYRNF